MLNPYKSSVEHQNYLRMREEMLGRTLRQMAMGQVVQSAIPMISPRDAYFTAGPLLRSQPEEIDLDLNTQQQLAPKNTFDLWDQGEFYGVATPERFDPDTLGRIVSARREGNTKNELDEMAAAAMETDDIMGKVLGGPGLGAARTLLDMAKSVPFLGDAVSKMEGIQDADKRLSRLEEEFSKEYGTAGKVSMGAGGMVAYAAVQAEIWAGLGLAGALPKAAQLGVRLSAIGRANQAISNPLLRKAIQGATTEWLTSGGGDAPLTERAIQIGLGAAFGAGESIRGVLGGAVSGVGLGMIMGGVAGEGSPESMIIGGALGGMGGAGLGLFLRRAQRSFPSKIVEGDWYFDESVGMLTDGSAPAGGSLSGPPPRKMLPPGPPEPEVVVIQGGIVPTSVDGFDLPIPGIDDIKISDFDRQYGLAAITPEQEHFDLARVAEEESFSAIGPSLIKTPMGYVTYVQHSQGSPDLPRTKHLGVEVAPYTVTDIETTPFLKTSEVQKKVHHGTKHVFPVYDMSKVGSLEGGPDQTYVGHGIYFSENPQSAEGFIGGSGYDDSYTYETLKKNVDKYQNQFLALMQSPNKIPSNATSWDKDDAKIFAGDWGGNLTPEKYKNFVIHQMESFQKQLDELAFSTKAANIYPAQLNIQKALWLDRNISGVGEARAFFDTAKKMGFIKGDYQAFLQSIDMGGPTTYDKVWKKLQSEINVSTGAGYKKRATQVLEKMGYDGITYKGHMYSDGDGRAWLVFHPWQVYSPYAPKGNSYQIMWDPSLTPRTQYSVSKQTPLVQETDPIPEIPLPQTTPSVGMVQQLKVKSPGELPYTSGNNMYNPASATPQVGVTHKAGSAVNEYPFALTNWEGKPTVPQKPPALAPYEAKVEAINLTKHSAIMESPALPDLAPLPSYTDADVAHAVAESYPEQVGLVKNVSMPTIVAEDIINSKIPQGVISDFRIVAVGGMPKPQPELWDPGIVTTGVILKSNLGSNTGHLVSYNGTKYYIKNYQNPDQMATENIANAVYRALGVKVPQTGLAQTEADGLWHVSKWLEDAKTLKDLKSAYGSIPSEYADQALQGFVADVLLANWDAAGTGLDNMAIDAWGDLYRIDQGGALTYRAMGDHKDESVLHKLTELENFIPGGKNSYYSQLFDAFGWKKAEEIDSLSWQIEKVMTLAKQPGGWRAIVEKYGTGMSPMGKDEIVEMLDARTQALWEWGNKVNVIQNSSAGNFGEAVEFIKGEPLPFKDLNGVPFDLAFPAPNNWVDAPGIALIDETPIKNPNGKKISTGIIAMEPDGSMWLYEPTDHFGGYNHTFPKGNLEEGLSYQENALKEAYEETGMTFQITDLVGDFEKSTSVTRYYLAHRTGGKPTMMGWEAQAVKLVPAGKVDQYLNTPIDKKIADAALGIFASKGKTPPPKSPDSLSGNPQTFDLLVTKKGSINQQMVDDYQKYGMFRGQEVTLATTGQIATIETLYPDGWATIHVAGGNYDTYQKNLLPNKNSHVVENLPGQFEGFLKFAENTLGFMNNTGPKVDLFSNEGLEQIPWIIDGYTALHPEASKEALEMAYLKVVKQLAPHVEQAMEISLRAELKILHAMFPPRPVSTAQMAAVRGFDYQPENGVLVDVVGQSGLSVPIDSPEAAQEFLKNFQREPLDDGPIAPIDLIETPPGYSETYGDTAGDYKTSTDKADALEDMIDGYDQYGMPLEDAASGYGGWSPPPPGIPPGGAFLPGGEPFGYLPPFDNSHNAQWARARKDDPRRVHNLLSMASSIVSELGRPTRNLFIRLEADAKKMGITMGRYYEFVSNLETAHTRMVNQSNPWKEQAFNAIGKVRNKYIRNGTLWEVLNASDESREALMKEYNFKKKERQAVADWDALMQKFHTEEALPFFPEMGNIKNYVSWMRKFEERLPGDPRLHPDEDAWGAELRRRADETNELEKDLSNVIPRYFDGFYKFKEMAPEYEAYKANMKGPDIPEVLKKIANDWADARMWGLDPTNDRLAKGWLWGLNAAAKPLGLKFTIEDVMKMSYTGFATGYRAALGAQISPLIRDLPQMIIGGMHVGLDQMLPTLHKFVKDSKYRDEVIAWAHEAGVVQKGHGLGIEADLFGGTKHSSQGMKDALGETQAIRREQLGSIGDFYQDKIAGPLGIKQGMAGKWFDPLKVYGQLGDFARAVTGRTGYETALRAIQDYQAKLPYAGREDLDALRRELLDNSRVARYQGTIQDIFLRNVDAGDLDGAARFFANEVANSQNRYGMTEHPYGWRKMGPLTGRLGMRFQTFNTQTLANFGQILSDPQISLRNKASYATQVGTMQAIFAGITAVTGWNLMKMSLEGLVSLPGDGIFSLVNNLQRAEAIIETTASEVFGMQPTLTPEQQALMGSGNSDYGSTYFTLDPTRSSFNPYQGAFRTAQGFGEAAQWGPEGAARFLVTGERSDPWTSRLQRHGLTPQGQLPPRGGEIPVNPNFQMGPQLPPFVPEGVDYEDLESDSAYNAWFNSQVQGGRWSGYQQPPTQPGSGALY